MAPYTDGADDETSRATELVDGRDSLPSNLCEDCGEAVGRTASNNHVGVGVDLVLAVDGLTGLEPGRYPEQHLHERQEAGLDGTKIANGDIDFPQPKTGAAIAGSKSHSSSAPIKRHRQRKSINAIDDLFQGLN